MKWTKKGHEFDEVYKQIAKKTHFYLFGAGDYGNQFYHSFAKEIDISGYIDNAPEKQGKKINGIQCDSPADVPQDETAGIIITMSQFARVGAVKQMAQMGLRKNVDFFIIEEFISIYYVYKYDKVYFSSISFLPSTTCNLKCRHCLNFNPFAQTFYVRNLEELKADADLFFKCVDHIMLFHISGGEPMLYRDIAKLIQYISDHYKDQIDTLRTVTNGTIVPNDEILATLSQCKVEITVDDYREAVPQFSRNFEELIKKLEEYKIKYYINKVDSWINLDPENTDFSDWEEERLCGHFNQCMQSWQELRDGKLYMCNYAAYAVVAGLAGEEDNEETFSLIGLEESRKKELIEFRLGYSKKGYTNFCKSCKGFNEKNKMNVAPAKQC